MNLWSVAVNRNGQRARDPVKLTAWEGQQITALSLAADGKSGVVVRAAAQTDVYIAALKPDGTLAAEPRRFTFDDRNDRPTGWSNDGKAVLFASDRNGSWDIYRQALDSDTPEPLATGPDRQVIPRMTPDGRGILFVSWPAESEFQRTPARMMLMPSAGVVPHQVAMIPDYAHHRCGAAGCLVEQFSDKSRIVSEFDPERGKGRELFRHDRGDGDVALSPDGQRLAWVLAGARGSGTRIRIADGSGTTVSDIEVHGATFLRALDWQHDGQGFYAGSELIGKGAALMHIDMNGKSRVLWEQPAAQMIWGVPSPDGRHLGVLGASRESNVWMLSR
jgi:Tol biopolymer transport system component